MLIYEHIQVPVKVSDHSPQASDCSPPFTTSEKVKRESLTIKASIETVDTIGALQCLCTLLAHYITLTVASLKAYGYYK